jgi:hypothetical protein
MTALQLRMPASVEAPISVQPRPVSRSQTFRERLSKLPEELIIQVLEHILDFPGNISKKDFWAGKCEWPGCLCEHSDWVHTPGEELTKTTLIPFSSTPKPIPRLAQYVFYKVNTFHVCDPRSDMDWANGFDVWLPPRHARQWIKRLELEVMIEEPRWNASAYDSRVFGQDTRMLRQMQRAVEGFRGLRTLRLMFETTFVTKDDKLEMLDQTWGTLEPFHFQTPELVLEACSVRSEWGGDVREGDLVRDERLERLLAKHVSASGTIEYVGGKENWTGGEYPRWQGKL